MANDDNAYLNNVFDLKNAPIDEGDKARKMNFKDAQNAPIAEEMGHPDKTESDDDVLKSYIGVLQDWKKEKTEDRKAFTGNAVAVDENLEKRLEYAKILSERGLLDHGSLSLYSTYVIADRTALAKPNHAEEAYERFQERRDELRDRLGLTTLRISAKEYGALAGSVQRAMVNGQLVDLHRDFVSIRKEVAQENAMHPRFIAEVSTSKNSLFDELLVDLDRGDLIQKKDIDQDGNIRKPEKNDENYTFHEDSRIRGELFSQEVARREDVSTGNSSSNIRAFTRMIAVGKQVAFDPLAIKTFADIQRKAVGDDRTEEFAGLTKRNNPITGAVLKASEDGFEQLGGKDYEIGIAALENKKFSAEMTIPFLEAIKGGQDLPEKTRQVVFGHADAYLNADELTHDKLSRQNRQAVAGLAADPMRLFVLANAAFQKQFKEGDAQAGMSYAVMEYAAERVMNDPQAMKAMSAIDIDASQSVEQFRHDNKKSIQDEVGGKVFEKKVFEELKRTGAAQTESQMSMSGMQITEKGAIDIAEVLKPKSAEMYAVIDNFGNIVLAASPEGHDAKDAVTLPNKQLSENQQPLDFTQGQTPGKPFSVYVEFDNDGKVMIAADKDKLEAGDYIHVNDEFHSKSVSSSAEFKNNSQKGPASSLKDMLTRQGPYIHIETGGEVFVAATKADFDAKRSVPFSLYGINVPPPGKDFATKDDAFDAGEEAKSHLIELLDTYGERGIKVSTVDGRDGKKELKMQFANGEDVSYRMIRDGYALPSECKHMSDRRESAANNAQRGNFGLWAHGFPEDDGNWRSESLMPHLTRKDKRDNLDRTMRRSMAGSAAKAGRIFSDKSAELFSLSVSEKWEHPSFYREAWEAAQNNPERMLKLYNNNVKLMKEIRGRKDGLTEQEKVAHDQLTIGARLIGNALANVGEKRDPETGKKSWKFVSPMEVIKDTETLMSKRGLQIPRSIKDTFNKGIDKAGEYGEKSLDGGKQFIDYLSRTADAFVR